MEDIQALKSFREYRDFLEARELQSIAGESTADLQSFRGDALIETKVREIVETVDSQCSVEATPYYALEAFPELLDDVLELLARCHQYRKDILELEMLQLSEMHSYSKSVDLTAELKAEELGRARAAFSTMSASAFAKAMAAFDGSAEVGFKHMAEGAHANALAIERESVGVSRAIANRFDVQVKYAELALLRLKEPDVAHNYAERVRRLMMLFARDFREAYNKALRAANGAKRALGVNLLALKPDLNNRDALFNFTNWIRDIRDDATRLARASIEFDNVIGLTGAGPNAPTPSYSGEAFSTVIRKLGVDREINEGTVFRVEVPQLADYPFVSLLGVAASIEAEKAPDGSSLGHGYGALKVALNLVPPRQKNPLSGKMYDARRIPLRWISSVEAVQVPNYERGPHVRNIDPRGVWTVEVEPIVFTRNGSKWFITERYLNDIRLHFRIRAVG